MLMRFDPFRAVDRAFEEAFGPTRASIMPMDAYRRGDHFVVHIDLPGVDPGSIDVSVQQNVLTVSAERHWEPFGGDDVLASERPQGTFRRQIFLGNTFDSEAVEARYDNGVLSLTLPVADEARPRRIEVTSSRPEQAITAGSN